MRINNDLSSFAIDRPDSMARTIAPPAKPADATAFTGELGRAIASVDKLQVEADTQASAVARGAGNLHEMAISLEKADVAMRLAVRVRNKVVETYNEIMKMGV
jgi:flagellar hook-basal body complex protein FliE